MQIDICEFHQNSSRVLWLTQPISTLDMDDIRNALGPLKTYLHSAYDNAYECHYIISKQPVSSDFRDIYYLYQRGIGCTEHWCLDVEGKKKTLKTSDHGKRAIDNTALASYVEGCESSSFPGVIAIQFINIQFINIVFFKHMQFRDNKIVLAFINTSMVMCINTRHQNGR